MGGFKLNDQLLDPDVPTLASQDKLKVSPKGLPFVNRLKVAMRKRSHVHQLWSHSCTHCVRITGLHALRRSRSNQPLVRIVLEGCGRYCQRYGGCAPRCGRVSPRWGIRLSRMVFRDARGFSTGLCREAVLHRCSLVSSNMVCERSTGCVRLPGAHARHRSRFARPHCAGFVLYCATSWPASYCCDCLSA